MLELREDLKLGQRIAGFYVQVEVDGVWQEFGRGFTVGHKRSCEVTSRGAKDARDDYGGTGFACLNKKFHFIKHLT